MAREPLIWTQQREPGLLVPGRKPVGAAKVDLLHRLAPNFAWFPNRGTAEELLTHEHQILSYIWTGGNANAVVDGREVVSFAGSTGTGEYVFEPPGAGNCTFILSIKTGAQSSSFISAMAVGTYTPGIYTRYSSGNWGLYHQGAMLADSALAANTWYHLAVVRRGTGSTETLFYLDGKDDGSSLYGGNISIPRIAFGTNISGAGSAYYDGDIEYVYYYDHALGQEDVQSLKRDPCQFILSANDAPFLFSVAAGGDTDVSAGTAALTLTAYPATVNAETNVQADKSAHIIIAWRADINAGINVAADAAALSITTQPATVNAETYVSSSVASLTLATSAATVQVGADVNVSAGTAALTLTELVATVNAAKDIVVNVAALTLSTPAATISLGVDVQATTSALTLTVHAATIAVTGATNVAAATAALTINTYGASVLSGAVHMRTQIRDAVATALAGLTQTGSRVFLSRSLPLGAETPAILIYTNNETAEYDLGEMICIPRRLITLTVEGYHHGDDDDILDQIALEVETALFSDPTLGGLAEGISNTEQTLSRESEGAKNTGVITMEFGVAYRAADGAPATAVN